MEENTKVAPEQKIVHSAKTWRQHDRAVIKDKGSRDKQRAEYRARQQLRDAVDQAGEH